MYIYTHSKTKEMGISEIWRDWVYFHQTLSLPACKRDGGFIAKTHNLTIDNDVRIYLQF